MTAPDYIVQRERRWDFLKGVMLIILAAGHLKGYFPAFQRATSYLWAPFGFFSMAEGFLFLSAIITGISLARKSDQESRKRTVYDRTIRIYLFQVLLTLVVYLCMLSTENSPFADLNSFHKDPDFYVLLCVLLIHCAPLLDILPTYILFLPLSLLLLRGFQSVLGTVAIFSLSILCWWLSQSFRPWESDYFNLLKTFSPFAWQILFVSGFWIGAVYIRQRRFFRIPKLVSLGGACVCLVGACYCWCVRFQYIENPFFADIRFYSERRFALPAFGLVNFFLFCGALRLIGCFNYGSWPVFRFIGNWYGRESLIVFSWNAFLYYTLLGMEYYAHPPSKSEQFYIYTLLLLSSLVPVGLAKLLKRRRRRVVPV